MPYSGHAKISASLSFISNLFFPLCSDSGDCVKGGFELYWLFGLLRRAEEPQATLGTCQHHSCQQSLTDQGFIAWCFSGEQHLYTSSRLFSYSHMNLYNTCILFMVCSPTHHITPDDIFHPWQNHCNIQSVIAY